MNFRFVLLSATMLVSASAAAQAADPIIPMPTIPVAPEAMIFDWTGVYAGINAGYGFGRAVDGDGNALVLDDGFGLTSEPLDNISGLFGGVQIGANYQMDMFVLGIEGDVQISGMSQTVDFGGDDVIGSLDYFGTVRARAGVAIDNFMPYVTGGLAFGRGTLDDTDFDAASIDHQNHFGWTAGVGAEVAVSESISFKAEYLYTDLRTATYTLIDGPVDMGFRVHTVRAGVNFHF
ncbi:outer membrane protein [Pelagibacterium lentulum]|uniref:Porin n=1 Tax=Pelagibacterium lentulum TaxID=2029865 RepID=A0A916RJK8_9HYPH|nr:outer membrane protein [Pelagibacterium lentulum]GGA59766.1 porin [Pelagibacterium lentulum]